MQPTLLRTYAIPPVGSPPIPLLTAAQTPLRVLIRALVGTSFLSTEQNELTQTALPGGATYSLPAATSDIFVLPQGKTLYALNNGAAGLLSLAASETLAAFPETRG